MSKLVLPAIALALGLLCAPIWADPAFADKRVALVVGNSAYQHAPALPNPAKDARAIAAMFQKAGFDVVSAQYDVGNLEFKRAIRQFEDAAADADIAVVYYAGHGIEIHGINYLVPVDAKLASDRDADDEAITLERLVASVDGARRLRVVILDACRDNPFSRTMKQQRTAALRGINPGLGASEPSGINTLIAYAAKAGSVAEDGQADHSPFTAALMNHLFVPGLDIRLAFGRVRDEVLKKTGNRQEPFVYGSLGGANVAIVPLPEQEQRPVAAAPVADADGEKSDYGLVEKIGTKGAWEVFINQHPKGFYSDLARQQITKLALGEPSPPTAPRGAPQPDTVAALEPPKPPTPPGPTTQEQKAWDKVKDSSDAEQFRTFIKRYPTSPLANAAQSHLDALDRAAQEKADREATQRAEAARQAQLAEAKRQADEVARQKAEQQAALERAQQESKAAEEARQKAERDAALKRAEEDRQRQLAEAARAKQQADANAARQKADQEAALKQATNEAIAAEEERIKAEREASVKRNEEQRQKALADAGRAKQDAACKSEQDRLSSLQAAGSKARDDLRQLEQGLTCEQLRPMVVAAIDRAAALPATNTPAQVRTAQQELNRLGCFTGAADGSLSTPTKAALQRYENQRGKSATNVDINDALLSELKDQTARVCPLTCPSGKVADGEQCVVADKPHPAVARHEDEDQARRKAKAEDNTPAPKHQQAKQQEAPSRPQPRVRQEASSGGRGGGGGYGGGGHGGGSAIGVGF